MPLHVTNGLSAVARLRAAGIEGEFLPWDDVLHEGPVPAGLDAASLRDARAGFIAASGWAPLEEARAALVARDARLEAARDGDEVVLWFEHDLYDQLQLVQVLDRIGDAPVRARVTLALASDYLGRATPDAVHALHAARSDVTPAVAGVARRAWAAVRGGDPAALCTLADDPALAVLPHLAAALHRLLDELPGARDGLSRSERQALEAIADGHDTPAAAWQASHHEREPAVFLGDSTFAGQLARLSACRVPLVRFADGGEVRAPRAGDDGAGFWQRRVALTEQGRAVLAGGADHVALNGVDRWIGGVHLGAASPWRRDGARVVRVR